MPFRFSDLLRRRESTRSLAERPFHLEDDYPPPRPPPPPPQSRPVTGASAWTQPAMPVSSRTSSTSSRRVPSARNFAADPVSICYDNGTGRLNPNLARESGLPASVTTTDQLAEYIRSRDRAAAAAATEQQDSYSPVSSSHYSHATGFYRASGESTFQASPSSVPGHPPPSYRTNPLGHSLTRRFFSQQSQIPVTRSLPGTTRKHKYQGFWLRRGTMRREKPQVTSRERSVKGSNTAQRPKQQQTRYVETSGWYDDSDD